MNVQQQLSQISIQEERVPGAQSVHFWRRFSQYAVIVLLVLIPVSGLFRIDPMAGAFRVLDYQVWFSDIAIVMGFWLMAATLLVFMYSWAGSVFCGWACPQNTVSEWANAMTARLLGRRASMMDVTGQPIKLALRKNNWLNKVMLGLSFLLISMLIAIIPLLYFFPPNIIASFLLLEPLPEAKNLLWIYVVCVLVVLVNVSVMRHLVCKYMCIYRVWQHSFKTKNTLHIAYDVARLDDCKHCNYCVDSCFLDIDPRQAEVFDSCINCGDCVAACDDLHHKSKKMQGPGLLSFSFGSDGHKTSLGSLLSRTRAVTAGAVIGILFFIIGLVGYQPYMLVVDRAELMQGTNEYDYRIHMANKRYQQSHVNLVLEGLEKADYSMDKTSIDWRAAGRQDVLLHLSPNLKKGMHRFVLRATSDDGWQDTFMVYYYASGVGES